METRFGLWSCIFFFCRCVRSGDEVLVVVRYVFLSSMYEIGRSFYTENRAVRGTKGWEMGRERHSQSPQGDHDGEWTGGCRWSGRMVETK